MDCERLGWMEAALAVVGLLFAPNHLIWQLKYVGLGTVTLSRSNKMALNRIC